MTALGLPDFGPVQQNDSYNGARGVTRGVHAEPWDKFVSIATGLAYGAWVDLREGPSFGTTYTHELGPDTAVFVPRGVGNAYQVLEDATAYSYLVNAHWRPDAGYTEVNPADPTSGDRLADPARRPVELSQKDRDNPALADVTPMAAAPVLVVGGSGQVGTALRAGVPGSPRAAVAELDLADPDSVARFDFSSYDVVLNAAAYTAVDAAETDRRGAWAANATGPALLAAQARSTASRWCTSPPTTSSTARSRSTPRTNPCPRWGSTARARPPATSPWPHPPALPAPHDLGGRRRPQLRAHHAAAGPRRRLAHRGRRPGRPADVRRRARPAVRPPARHPAPYGAYNVTNGGDAHSWAGFARAVFTASGRSADDVSPVSTEEYGAGKDLAPARRTRRSRWRRSARPGSSRATCWRTWRRTSAPAQRIAAALGSAGGLSVVEHEGPAGAGRR